jgi:hypothetical protein
MRLKIDVTAPECIPHGRRSREGTGATCVPAKGTYGVDRRSSLVFNARRRAGSLGVAEKGAHQPLTIDAASLPLADAALAALR